jgi:hypothetical protein
MATAGTKVEPVHTRLSPAATSNWTTARGRTLALRADRLAARRYALRGMPESSFSISARESTCPDLSERTMRLSA